MSDIILIRENIDGTWWARTRYTSMNHQEALDYVKTYPGYEGQLGSIVGVTADDFWPLDDSDLYLGWDSVTESIVMVTSNPSCYCSHQTLKLLFSDDSTEILYDSQGNEIHGLLEADK